jgi:hypothetical protein|tara:strand:- start:2138 stop:2422 length:285 start_codon:yes stop_codon:yes gene_type:complete
MRITKSRLKEIILEELRGDQTESPLEESALLSESMLEVLAPKIIAFIVKNPKLLEMLAKAVGPIIAKTMGDEKGGAEGGAMADLASAVSGITEE